MFCAGIIRLNELHLTPELDKSILENMQRGGYQHRTKESVIVTVWRDNRFIHLTMNRFINLISNAYPVSGDTTVARKCKTDGVVEQVACPPVICGYNSFMGGVDQNDHK